MARYLTKKRRNIRKYKKSRIGRGKGRRSVKRHTVGKRRRMMGGSFDYIFRINRNIIYPYLARKNPRVFSQDREQDFILVGFGIAMITKESARIKEDNRVEKISIFRQTIKNQGQDDSYIFVIARCEFQDYCFDMDNVGTTIVVEPGRIENPHLDSIELQQVKRKLTKKFDIMLTSANIDKLEFKKYTFPNMLSPSDKYKIILLSSFTDLQRITAVIDLYRITANPINVNLQHAKQSNNTTEITRLTDELKQFTDQTITPDIESDIRALQIYEKFSPKQNAVNPMIDVLNISTLFSFIYQNKSNIDELSKIPEVEYPVQQRQHRSTQSDDYDMSTGLLAASIFNGLASLIH